MATTHSKVNLYPTRMLMQNNEKKPVCGRAEEYKNLGVLRLRSLLDFLSRTNFSLFSAAENVNAPTNGTNSQVNFNLEPHSPDDNQVCLTLYFYCM